MNLKLSESTMSRTARAFGDGIATKFGWARSLTKIYRRPTKAASIHGRDWYLASHTLEVFAIWPGDELETRWNLVEAVTERADREKLALEPLWS